MRQFFASLMLLSVTSPAFAFIRDAEGGGDSSGGGSECSLRCGFVDTDGNGTVDSVECTLSGHGSVCG